jgi:hypothetical protein
MLLCYWPIGLAYFIHCVVYFDSVGDFHVVFGVLTVNRLKKCYSFGGAGRVFGAYGDPLYVLVDFAQWVEAWAFDWQCDLEVSGVGEWRSYFLRYGVRGCWRRSVAHRR